MHVVVVDPPAYTPPYDHALCRALAARGLDVELITARFTHGEAPEPDGYRRSEAFGPPLASLLARRPGSPLRVPLKLTGHVAGLVALGARAARTKPDIVHWQWAPIPRLDRRAVRALRGHARASVFTSHDILPRRSADQVGLWRDLYSDCARVIVHSERGRERLIEEVGVAPERIAVIPHALFDGLAGGVAPEPPRAAGERILFFGLLREDKGLDVLIEALPAVVDAVPGARLAVVGSPRMPLAPLQERAAALGVAGAIDWDARFVDDAELAAAFRAADAIALPYRQIEGSGVLATALAFGVVPVTTAVGSFPELAAAYDLPAPVPPDDAAALAAALVSALTDAGERAAAGAGMARAREELTWERTAALTAELYDDVLA